MDEKGELETVKGVVENREEELHFSHDGESALYKAFEMAEHSSNPEEVTEVLDKCIPTSDECENEQEKAENVLKILKLRDGNGLGLFDYAVSNEKIEVFVRILEYCKKIVGNPKFIDEIIKSEEYRKEMDYMIKIKCFYKVVEVIKSLHSVFGNEIEMFFDQRHKIRIIRKSIEIRDESRNGLQEAINLIIEHFGIANLKLTLLSCDYDGCYLIHHLVMYNVNAIKNLNVIQNYLDDESEMKQFLMFKDTHSSNVFHLVAEAGSDSLGEILRFCNENLDKEEMKEMLVSCDCGGRNLLHLVLGSYSSERIIENLNLIKDYLADAELFKECLKNKDFHSMNVFHFASWNINEVNVSFLNSHLSKREIKELLLERGEDGWTCLICGTDCSLQNSLNLLNYSFEIMKDDQSQFEELILAKDTINKGTFLHWVVKSHHLIINVPIVIEIIESLKEKVSDEVFRELLRSRDLENETFLQIGMRENEEIIKEIEKVLEKEFIEELLEKQEFKKQ